MELASLLIWTMQHALHASVRGPLPAHRALPQSAISASNASRAPLQLDHVGVHPQENTYLETVENPEPKGAMGALGIVKSVVDELIQDEHEHRG